MNFPLVESITVDQSECDLRWNEKWLAVDLDGTLVTYDEYLGDDVFGDIVQHVADDIHERHLQGWKIAIFTSRARTIKGVLFVKEFLQNAGIGFDLITNVKKPYFREFWDDRAVPLKPTKTVIESGVVNALDEAGKVFLERNRVYGDAYKSMHPEVMQGLFPGGISLVNEEDHCRFGLLGAIVGKMTRYCANFHNGGHQDSLTDLMAFVAMLKDYDDEISKR